MRIHSHLVKSALGFLFLLAALPTGRQAKGRVRKNKKPRLEESSRNKFFRV